MQAVPQNVVLDSLLMFLFIYDYKIMFENVCV